MTEFFSTPFFNNIMPTAFLFAFFAYFIGRHIGREDYRRREQEITLERQRRGIDWKFSK